MLGGFPQISRIDLRGSANFLAKVRRLIQVEQFDKSAVAAGQQQEKKQQEEEQQQQQQQQSKKWKRGADCGAGIGRVTEGFLSKVCETVDVVEPVAKFADIIRRGPLMKQTKQTKVTKTEVSIGNDNMINCQGPKEDDGGIIENIYVIGLENWVPEPQTYDLIWNQWCVGHLTDAQLTAYLQRAAAALTPQGILVLKENNSTDPEGKDVYDEIDSSVTRTDETFRKIFKNAGLNLIKAEEQLGFPKHLRLLPVRSYALRPQTT